MRDRSLPAFTEEGGNIKLRPLDEGFREPSAPLQRFVAQARLALGRSPSSVRVLDVGCGRGDTVAWLCEQGYDAYGVDVRADYLDMGRGFLDRVGHGGGRLREVVDDRYPFDDGSFDVVLSDQVLEHVVDLDAFAREVARVGAPGSTGLHLFPARWRPVEVHMKTPLVHWLPKGRARRVALHAVLGLGGGASYFDDLALGDRVEVFAHYADTETFYRPLSAISAAFARQGMRVDVTRPSRERVAARLPAIPEAMRPAAGLLYRTMFSVCLETVR